MATDRGQRDRPRIVIVGGGFGGAYCAQRLGKLLGAGQHDIVLLDRHNYLLFTPLLLEAGAGSLEPRHAVVPIRAFLRRGRFIMADVTDVDFASQSVRYNIVGPNGLPRGDEPQELTYDQLVLAPGSVTRLPDVPGLKEHGFQIKSLGDAVSLRDRLITLLEAASNEADAARRRELLHIVVVGANFTGAEVAGEFDMVLRAARRHYPMVDQSDIRVTLIEIQDRILGLLGRELSDFAAEHLRARGVDIRLETTVERVERDHVVLNTGEKLPTQTIIWCAGIEPAPLIRRLDLPKDERGYLICERDLRVKKCTNIWAIGDSAVNIDANGQPYPATAQHAVGQAKHLANNIAAVLRGGTAQPCDLRSKGTLAALGCRTGVAEVFGIKLSGFPAWWLWRTVYLLKMPTLARKVRVALDWTMDLLFSRDYVQLGVHRSESASGTADDEVAK